jgi:ankyrin repeat protein
MLLVQPLLARHANPNAPVGSAGETPMHMARTSAMIALLAKHGGNINVALYNAVLRNDIQEVQRLLGLGADPNAPVPPSGKTAMEAALTLEMIILLLTHGGDINLALYNAVLRNDAPVAQRLLDLGANPNALAGPSGETAGDAARTLAMKTLLIRKGCNINLTLYYAVQRQNLQKIQQLLMRGADPYAPVNLSGETAIDAAYTPEMVVLLCSRGDINVALYLAVLWQDVPEIQQLIKQGANPHERVNSWGETVMTLARRIGNPAILALFAPPK